MTLSTLISDLRDGSLSAVDHISSVLHRIESLRGGPWENLVVNWDFQQVLGAQALLLARELDAKREAGAALGPLHGLAVVVKDLIDVKGVPTRCGSAVFARREPATEDAAIVGLLRSAGAVVVAKTHLHEFAYGPTGAVSVDGPALNPHDTSRITGGSSSGSAGLVALGVAPLAIGTDTGCSVRTPAALCGVVGVKPPFGALPTSGVFPLSGSFDHVGFFTPTIDDARVVWGALGLTAGQRPESVSVGRLRGAGWEIHDSAIAAAVDRAEKHLRAAGYTVVDVEMPEAQRLVELYTVITGSEALATHDVKLRSDAEKFQPLTRERLEAQRGRSATEYISALRERDELRKRISDRLSEAHIDVLLTATTPLRATTVGVETVGGDDGVSVPVRPEMLRMCIPFSVLGYSAVSTPVTHPDGLPSGVQIVGLPHVSADVPLTVASALDSLT
ncbi:amidase [Hoyosella rhizosphaerae]|uniref:Amidohydrolase n=1 Tax=Hoyosella rhizosphaerae TaxID=1755582 RepID=A0A916XIV1_9ACTN|nr:amidase [Hoyosella rhizosphaerae]MBN4925432.1 amidase [Hoyosella rhizosphaerae]GGC75240.1 amidohydrolase [Hoyosella rhizosphaerae]